MDYRNTEIRETYVTDRLAVARNVAINGRLFCSMIFVASIAAFIMGKGAWFANLAMLAALPVGLSCIGDMLPRGPLRIVASVVIYATAMLAFFLFVLNVG